MGRLEGRTVGAVVGVLVGRRVGSSVGDSEGILVVGKDVGFDHVGKEVVGTSEGTLEGWYVGCPEG